LSRERYRKSRVDDDVFSRAELLFAWGPENALAWTEVPTYRGQPIHQTGNGRIDLLRPETRRLYNGRCAELKARHGDFILVNTNFGAINHFMDALSANVRAEDTQQAVRGHDNGYLLHRQIVLRAFVELLPDFAKRFPKHKIILRPHPSESHAFWRTLLKDCPNVEINNEGNVVPWILASQALVHNGCTTGLEAYILGKMTIAYQPVISDEFDLHVPNELSLSVKTEPELLEIMGQVLQGKLGFADLQNKKRDAILKNIVSATTGDLATESIAGVLDDFVSSEVWRKNLVTWPVGAAITLGRAAIKRFNRNRPGHKSNIAYSRHRFPQTELGEVQSRIVDFGACLNCFSKVIVRQDSDNIFVVTSS
jgi:surface carbohydrate biosynthesis protein